MSLDGNERRKVDNMSPEMKETSLGSEVGGMQDEIGYGVSISGVDFSSPIIITYDVDADATTPLVILNSNCPFPLTIIDVIVECTTANASGTLLLDDGTTAITDAMICAVDKTIVRAGTIDDATATIALNGTLRVTSNGAADRGKVTIIAKRN